MFTIGSIKRGCIIGVGDDLGRDLLLCFLDFSHFFSFLSIYLIYNMNLSNYFL